VAESGGHLPTGCGPAGSYSKGGVAQQASTRKEAWLSRLLLLVVDGGALEEAPEEVGQVDDAAHQAHHAHCRSYLHAVSADVGVGNGGRAGEREHAVVRKACHTSCAHEEGGGDEGDGTVQHGGLDHLPALHQIAEKYRRRNDSHTSQDAATYDFRVSFRGHRFVVHLEICSSEPDLAALVPDPVDHKAHEHREALKHLKHTGRLE